MWLMYDAKHQSSRWAIMRTTVNVEDDVFFAAKAIAKASGSTVGAVLSEWARRGHQRAGVPTESESGSPELVVRNGITLLPRRGVVVTSEQVYRLLDEDAA